MLLVEFAGASTSLITFREHADSSDMIVLVYFNSTQGNNTDNMIYNTSKIFLAVKCLSNNN